MPLSIPAMRSKPVSPITDANQEGPAPASTHEIIGLLLTLNTRRLTIKSIRSQRLVAALS